MFTPLSPECDTVSSVSIEMQAFKLSYVVKNVQKVRRQGRQTLSPKLSRSLRL